MHQNLKNFFLEQTDRNKACMFKSVQKSTKNA